MEAGLFVREQAAVDEWWVREQRNKLKLQLDREELVARARERVRSVFGDGDDERAADDAEVDRREEEAVAARWSELGRLGSVFVRGVSQPDAFSKLSRYETSIARRLVSTRRELAALQEARDRSE